MRQLTADLDSDVGRWAEEFVFGEVWSREGLEFEDRLIVAIVALAAQGKTTQLSNYLHAALREGVPPEKIQEALVMLTVYSGFPTASDALVCWRDVKRSHAEAGE